jgi:hypothetical protein
MHTSYSDPAVATFVVIPVLLAALLVWSAARATTTRISFVVFAAVIVWMSGTWIAAGTGVFRKWTQNPPPFGLLVVSIVILSVIIAFSHLGRALVLSLPLWALVAVQSFRLPLELAMHAMYERGIMPVQMSYSGRNFDIVTGASALIVAAQQAALGEHFTLDGTLIEAWAGQKSFKRRGSDDQLNPPPPDRSSNPTVNYRRESGRTGPMNP